MLEGVGAKSVRRLGFSLAWFSSEPTGPLRCALRATLLIWRAAKVLNDTASKQETRESELAFDDRSSSPALYSRVARERIALLKKEIATDSLLYSEYYCLSAAVSLVHACPIYSTTTSRVLECNNTVCISSFTIIINTAFVVSIPYTLSYSRTSFCCCSIISTPPSSSGRIYR